MKKLIYKITKKINLADVFFEFGILLTCVQCVITLYFLFKCTGNTYSDMLYLSELSFESSIRALLITIVFYAIMLWLYIIRKNK